MTDVFDEAKLVWAQVMGSELEIVAEEVNSEDEDLGPEYHLNTDLPYVIWRGYDDEVSIVGTRKVIKWKLGLVNWHGGDWGVPNALAVRYDLTGVIVCLASEVIAFRMDKTFQAVEQMSALEKLSLAALNDN